jgi:putative membrane protein
MLVIQLGASGGSYPVELSPPFFRVVHAWVPLTQSVYAFKHAVTGAFEGRYSSFMIALLGLALVSALLGLLGRYRWEFVEDKDFKPLLSSRTISDH